MMIKERIRLIKSIEQLVLCSFILLLLGSCSKQEKPTPKIALLFLTVNDLNHPNLWKKALMSHSDKFSIYIHSKNPMMDEFFKQYRIGKIVPTNWSIHMKAWQVLIQEALRDKRNIKFVFLSESCVPLLPLDEIYTKLISDDKSYMDYKRPWWPVFCSRTLYEFPLEKQWGNSEWIILNRKAAQMIAKDKKVIEIASHHDLDIESYPATFFCLKNLLNDSNVSGKITTYVDWDIEPGLPHPYHFKEANEFNIKLIETAREKGCFFARKFTKEFPEEILSKWIEYDLEKELD